MSKKSDANDPRFHYEIWKGPSDELGQDTKSIYYVENHNAQCSYAELAFDFGFAADELIKQYRETGYVNWIAPVAHVSRQLVELHLKALMAAIKTYDNAFDTGPLGGHNLESIWLACRNWLIERGYGLLEDARLEMAERLISAFHEIDPSGDLFRFGISRRTAFDKQKSYDRVGIVLEPFERELEDLKGLLNHWKATLVRENIKIEMGWNEDPFFNPDDFPRRPQQGAISNMNLTGGLPLRSGIIRPYIKYVSFESATVMPELGAVALRTTPCIPSRTS